MNTNGNGTLGRERGNALLVTLVMVGIIGVSLAATLDVVSNQNRAILRSLQWNSGVAVAEAGLEEALAHLHYSPTNRDASGWTLLNGVYTKERTIGESKFVTTISTSSPPDIVSRAYVRKPLATEYLDPPRTLKVTTTNDAIFSNAMVAKGKITFSGGVETDSFDPFDPNFSTNGQYDPAKTRDNGDVATNDAVEQSIDASGNVKIRGRLATGPGGAIGLSGGVSVGSKPWVDAGTVGIEPGWSSDDMNVNFQDVELPFTGGALTPIPGSVAGTNYTYVLTTGNWELSSLSLSGSQKVVVLGDATLLVTGDLSMSGQSYFYVSTNSSLRLYVGGSGTISGQGVANATGQSIHFQYYGLPSSLALNFSGNSAFIGVIYAPQAEFKMSGGGSETIDFIGASITREVSMSGQYKFHYDESLGRIGPVRGYIVTSWNEL